MFLTSKFLLFYTIVLTVVCVSSANSINGPGQKQNDEANVPILYRLGSNNNIVQLINPEGNSTTNISLVNGSLRCSCVNSNKCYCCADIRIHTLNDSLKNVCVTLETLEKANSTARLLTNFSWNNETLFSGESVLNVARKRAILDICFPVPISAAVSLCLKLDPLMHAHEERNVKACAHLEMRYKNSIEMFRFLCVSMGFDSTDSDIAPSATPSTPGTPTTESTTESTGITSSQNTTTTRKSDTEDSEAEKRDFERLPKL